MMEQDFRMLKWVFLGLTMAIILAAASVLWRVPCQITDGVTYCSFHERAEELHETWKALLNGW